MTDRDTPDEPSDRAADGGMATGIDEDELYEIVHDAVEDTILGAVGMLLLVGIGLLFLASGLTALGRVEGSVAVAIGLGVALLGGGLVVTTLTDVLSADRWF